MALHQPVKVANTFIGSFGTASTIDHLKLQKLCYYAYGWWLALRADQPRLMKTGPQVWKLGPVFLPIFAAFADTKGAPIREMRPASPFEPAAGLSDESQDELAFINWIWGRYGHFTGPELSEQTHAPGTPWYDIAKSYNFVIPKYTEMPDDAIRAYFDKLGRMEGVIN